MFIVLDLLIIWISLIFLIIAFFIIATESDEQE